MKTKKTKVAFVLNHDELVNEQQLVSRKRTLTRTSSTKAQRAAAGPPAALEPWYVHSVTHTA